MKSAKTIARTAGLLYLMIILIGIFCLRYVPSTLIVPGDASATIHNISSKELLFRLGIVVGLIGYTLFLFLPLVLYKLLRPVNEPYAKLMVILAVVSVPISFVNMLNNFAVLSIVDGPDYLKAFDNGQLQAQVLFYLDQYDHGNLIAEIFWGLWLFPFGYLVFKSGFLPKFLGILLMAGCVGYLIDFLGHSLTPGYDESGISRFMILPAGLGEIGICLWLLIGGVKNKFTAARS